MQLMGKDTVNEAPFSFFCQESTLYGSKPINSLFKKLNKSKDFLSPIGPPNDPRSFIIPKSFSLLTFRDFSNQEMTLRRR
jgi:hypothetical protein